MLAELGERELMYQYAMVDPVPAVVDVACEALYPEPIPLLLKTVTMVKGADANLTMRYHIPHGNYLYAEKQLVETYRKRKSRLTKHSIEGAGLAYLRSFGEYLPRYLNCWMLTYAQAKERLGPRAVSGVMRMIDSDGSDTWSREAECGVAAAVALRRLDLSVPEGQIRRMLEEASMAMKPDLYTARETQAILQWVLFDAGFTTAIDPLIEAVRGGIGNVLPDLLTTFLRRGEFARVVALAQEFNESLMVDQDAFHFWPLIDLLHTKDIQSPYATGQSPKFGCRGYVRAKLLGDAPPPWWKWMSRT